MKITLDWKEPGAKAPFLMALIHRAKARCFHLATLARGSRWALLSGIAGSGKLIRVMIAADGAHKESSRLRFLRPAQSTHLMKVTGMAVCGGEAVCAPLAKSSRSCCRRTCSGSSFRCGP